MYWLLARDSKLSVQNKVLIYKTALKPVWTYGIHMWVSATQSNIQLIQRCHNKILQANVNELWYGLPSVIQRDLHTTSITEETQMHSVKYRQRMELHPNSLPNNLLNSSAETRWLKNLNLQA